MCTTHTKIVANVTDPLFTIREEKFSLTTGGMETTDSATIKMMAVSVRRHYVTNRTLKPD